VHIVTSYLSWMVHQGTLVNIIVMFGCSHICGVQEVIYNGHSLPDCTKHNCLLHPDKVQQRHINTTPRKYSWMDKLHDLWTPELGLGKTTNICWLPSLCAWFCFLASLVFYGVLIVFDFNWSKQNIYISKYLVGTRTELVSGNYFTSFLSCKM